MSSSALTPNTFPGGDASAIEIVDAGGYFDSDNVEDALQELASGISAPATIYVATSGDDSTGDGSSGDPYETIARALQDVPRVLDSEVVIDVANGTYAEAIDVSNFVCTGEGRIRFTGDTTTPANVTFTGTVSHDGFGFGAETSTVLVTGAAVVEVEGIRVNATADSGMSVTRRGTLHVDRCTITGTLTRGIQGHLFASLYLHGDITISGWASAGLDLQQKVDARFLTPGTLTITGPGTTGVGVNIFNHSSLRCRGAAGAMDLTITGVLEGFHVSLNSLFQCLQPSSTLTVDNASTPSESSGAMLTDISSWSTNQAIVFDHLTYGFRCNSICYAEAAGSRTLTNVTDTDDASQNSVIYLP